MNNKYRMIIALFLIASILRLLLFIVVGPWQDEVWTRISVLFDAPRYHRIAINLVENNVFSISELPPYAPDMFITPIYPFFLASFYYIFGYKPYIAILLQCVIGSMTCILAYKIGRMCFGEKIAFGAGLLVAFEYSSILFANLLTTETLFTFIFIMHIYFLCRFIYSNDNKMLVISSLFLGISTLCRPVSVYFFLFVIGVFFLHFRKHLRKGIFKYSILALVFLLTIAPWVVRNYIVSGKFLVSSAQERVLYWNLPHLFNGLEASEEGVPPREVRRIPNPSNDPSRTRSDNQGMPTKTNSMRAVLSDSRRYVDGMMRFFLITGSSGYPEILGLPYYKIQKEDWHKGLWEVLKTIIQKKSVLEWFIVCFSISFLFFIYSTMFFGIYVAIKKINITYIVLFISIILYFAIAAGPFGYNSRYRVPIMPYILLLSSYGSIQLQGIFRKRI